MLIKIRFYGNLVACVLWNSIIDSYSFPIMRIVKYSFKRAYLIDIML